jgi:hypothetical protein
MTRSKSFSEIIIKMKIYIQVLKIIIAAARHFALKVHFLYLIQNYFQGASNIK